MDLTELINELSSFAGEPIKVVVEVLNEDILCVIDRVERLDDNTIKIVTTDY